MIALPTVRPTAVKRVNKATVAHTVLIRGEGVLRLLEDGFGHRGGSGGGPGLDLRFVLVVRAPPARSADRTNFIVT